MAFLLCLAVSGCSFQAVKLLLTGETRQLRERPQPAPPNAPLRPPILLVAIDGVGRDLLYDMLRHGELPQMADLLGGAGDARNPFPHAAFDHTLLSTLPSVTIPAWVTALTGVPPSRHGVTGNEFFIREKRQFAAPIPVSFTDQEPTLACFTDGYANHLSLAPSVYERMRRRDPHILIWVAMQHFYRGADKLILSNRTILTKALVDYAEEKVSEALEEHHTKALYADLDDEAVEDTVKQLDAGPVPDVLTIYLSGTDLFAHVSELGPDRARRSYLREVIDPLMGKLAGALRRRGALDDRYVVLTSDHGHTPVLHDEVHALAGNGDAKPPALLRFIHFRVRPFQLDVPDDSDFQAVLAYQGAMAYIYLADRSTCPDKGDVCDWSRPPRYREDVLQVADTFYRNNQHGAYVPGLRGTLDMVLTRRPAPPGEDARPFEVYVGNDKTVPVPEYLAAHPHPTYVDLDRRLRDLAAGPAGERAGDVLLIAHNGDRARPEQRYYFAAPYHSWHGSPSRGDSEIPLIVAHPHRSAKDLQPIVAGVLGSQPSLEKITDLLLALRFGDASSTRR